MARLEDLADHIITEEGAESEALQDVYDRYKRLRMFCLGGRLKFYHVGNH